MKPENIGNGCGATDDGHVSFIEIMKRFYVLLPCQSGANCLCGVASALNGHLRDARQRLSVFAERKCQIAHDKNIRVTGNGEVRIDFDAAAPVRVGLSAFAECSTELIRCNA